MSKDRENAIKVLSHLSPSIREAIAVFVESYQEPSSSSAMNINTRMIAERVRSLGK